MENVRAKRLARERLRLTCARLGLLHQALLEYRKARFPMMSADTDWKPIFTDYALMPTFRDLMEAGADTEVTKDDLLDLCETQMSTLEAQWREDRKRDFAIIATRGAGMFPGLTLPEDDDMLLSLAISSFDCQNCYYRGIRWPQVLAHRCVRSMTCMAFFYEDADRYRYAIARAAIEHKSSPPWPQDASFSFSSVGLERVFAVITACGKDPSTATFGEMEACNVRLLCRSCCDSANECSAFDWKNAVSAVIASRGNRVRWGTDGGNDAGAARAGFAWFVHSHWRETAHARVGAPRRLKRGEGQATGGGSAGEARGKGGAAVDELRVYAVPILGHAGQVPGAL